MPPNLKQSLNHLILADCSHRQFLSRQELAYKVLDLPEIRKSFNDVSIVGCYPRANLTEQTNDGGTVVFSDRTEYSAYAERCRADTKCVGENFDKESLKNMCFREFAETVSHTWVLNKSVKAEPIDPKSRRKFKTRDIDSGHWVLRKMSKRRHIRWSTVMYCKPAHLYEEVEQGKTTSQTLYFDLDPDKRRQLYRAYQELVCYRPWTVSPEESFLSKEVREKLSATDPEAERRHSLMKLEAFQRVYMDLWSKGEVAKEGSQWHRDNQYSYTMYLTNKHNSDMRLDRSENKGMFEPKYEQADELADLELPPPSSVFVEEPDMPSVLNFLPADMFRSILRQDPPTGSDIAEAYPLNDGFQRREEMVRTSRSSLFMADPPSPVIDREALSEWHKRAIELVTSGKQQVLYIYGKAGTGKTEVALHICDHYKGRVQAGAATGKAATNFNGPTVHAMFGWAHNADSQSVIRASEASKYARLRVFYEETEVFVIDEVNVMSASELGLLNEDMCKVFDPKGKLKNENGEVLPFGGKKVVFLGDAAQLRPVCGTAIYDSSIGGTETNSGRRNANATEYKRRIRNGLNLYRDILSKNCIWLNKCFRNKGLLLEIMDRVRNGEQTLADLDKLLYQRRKYPNVETAHGIHYSNESCSISNWLDLWETCKNRDPPQRLFISRATYHTSGENDLVISSLAALPPSRYNFAPDVLCVAEGCEVRLITNLNVSAGLANSATGTVVKVIYNNADVQALLGGQHPPAYSIIVDFPQFSGFLSGNKRQFPFPNRHWVPLYRQKFLPQTVPGWIRKKQSLSLCYREQFPLDLCRHITAHRGQGQTWKNQLVSVDLGLESPSNHIPGDIASIVYVACTRTDKLQNLFISPIFPSIWERIGKSDVDKARQESELQLRGKAEGFAQQHGWHKEFLEEQAYVSDYSENSQEWKEIVDATEPPVYFRESDPAVDGTQYTGTGDEQVPGWLGPVERERHIGIDQGVKNFAMVAVDKTPDALPRIVGAEFYNLADKGLNARKFDEADLVLVLQTQTVLMNWIQQPGYPPLLPPVDRVIVHLEQVSPKNKFNKVFAINLGRLLQRLCNVQNCVVKLSQPHIHRASGPMFKLGDKIVKECKLTPAVYTSSRKRPAAAGAASVGFPAKHPRLQNSPFPSDIEPDSTDSETETGHDKAQAAEYRRKKRMSNAIFRYFIHADFDQKMELQVDMSDTLQGHWKELDSSRTVTKFDDLGDALLHALDEILCGSSNYRPLIPASPALNVNRSVILAVLPDKIYWVVLQCTWNAFTLENMGVSDSHLYRHQKYSGRDTAEFIKGNLDPSLREALTQFTASKLYADVEVIKVIVKQLQAYKQLGLKGDAAGALTECTVTSMMLLCDETAGVNSRLSRVYGKEFSYTRTLLPSEHKLHVQRSTGKHTNAIVAFLEWSKRNIPSFVKNRPLRMSSTEKQTVFQALIDLSGCSSHQMEMVRLSSHIVSLLQVNSFSGEETQRMLADLFLIGLNKNGQYVSAVAPAYRHSASKSRK